MVITRDILDEKVPSDMFPTRLDSALNLYINIKDKGVILFNIEPNSWNVLYPFFELSHKFTVDEYQFSKSDMTYRELIEEYKNQFNAVHEMKNGFNKEKRQETLLNEFNKTFGLKGTSIGCEIEPCYELKYSKTKNTWTLYYFENYVLASIGDIQTLLNQNVYEMKYLPLNENPCEIDGVSVVENTHYVLSFDENINMLKEFQL